MKKKILPLLFAITLTSYVMGQQAYPSAEISNAHLKVQIYLPDAEDGFYRATRFDWSGVIGSLQYKGHEYFDPWLDYHDPQVHEAITGPVEAFYPIGYEEARAGGSFMVIGVGVLQKPDEKPYHFSRTYPILDPGEWQVINGNDAVSFEQRLTTAFGYAYLYTKRVALVSGRPELVIYHELENIGTRSIATTSYNHNFFVIDNEPTGPNIITRFSQPLVAEGKGFGDLIVARDSNLVFTGTLKPKENVYCGGLKASGQDQLDYDIRIENINSGAGVHISSITQLLKLPFWACATTSCPEPYINIDIAPGSTFRWQIKYRFYELDGH
ncbi:MAG: hypothetical protein HKN87_23000 [Saprospiraceae bacterium]|nr:hypothetical protein [Saprospiraceae bacterium]